MGLETGLLAASLALGAGQTAYGIHRQKKGAADAKDAAAKAQTQSNEAAPDMAKPKRRVQGFDPVMGSMTGSAAAGGAGLLGS